MKYTTNKKKNSKNGHGCVNSTLWPKGGVLDFDAQTINGVPTFELDDKLVRIVPDGYVAVCHLCNPPRPLTREENNNHDREVHNIKR